MPPPTSPTPQHAEDVPMDVLGPSIRIPAPRFKTAAPVVSAPARPGRLQDAAGRVPVPPRPSPAPHAQNGGPTAVRAAPLSSSSSTVSRPPTSPSRV
ncbi:uncharacterized protein BXZ73DRAFT_108841 [Epithele typhae]|uniref:uncharacterized protein n=1 Tax=Epithele typhae TaxID=378194 RepID=UPI002008BD08|nr:uncharacterized protein BXZ73DRAFT_108841 [Epithele typhae]KAH9910526.1 hypothetical protein BXZ73DRAFT_108841 [Epithele typhae]